MNTQSNPIALELRQIAARLRELFPESTHIELAATRSGIRVSIHNVGDYHAATGFLRRLGIGKWKKRVPNPDPDAPWSVAEGEAELGAVDRVVLGTTPMPRLRARLRLRFELGDRIVGNITP